MDELKPWMEPSEVEAIESLLKGLQPNLLNCLEWGSGGSTVHFPKLLRDSGKKHNWLSLEYNRLWAIEVQQAIEDSNLNNVHLKLFDSGSTELRPEFDFTDYINYPATLNQKFDFILVDGRCRRRCVLEAKKLLNDNGIIVLHDASRPWYQSALEGGNFVLPNLWVFVKIPQ
jgi:predicted O-methyltransferase YrrM